MFLKKSLDIYEKLTLLANGAKFDVSCASSGVSRNSTSNTLGSTSRFGICHSWSSDGRCISLLKILMTNFCTNDCAYCINRKQNDIERTLLKPDELAKITYEFYRRNYIEGLFLSSGIVGNPEITMEMMIKTVSLLRLKYGFNGYVHLKIIPNTSESTITEAIKWADRVSINIELPNEKSLQCLAPDKNMNTMLKTIDFVSKTLDSLKDRKDNFNSRGGQSTQIIVGASPDSDLEILRLSNFLYKRHKLKRVYYSAYIPINNDPRLPTDIKPPLLREHRLYQADWLIRFYGFKLNEIVSEEKPFLDENIDPKIAWALNNPDCFPIEINSASYEELLRVPGIGPVSAKRIVKLRKLTKLSISDLKKLGVVVKRARYFITINGKLVTDRKVIFGRDDFKSIFSDHSPTQYALSL